VADRVEVFARLVGAAASRSADALLIAGHLVEPGRLDPLSLRALEESLERARTANIAVFLTFDDDGHDGWLGYLAERGLVRPLVVGAAGPLPSATVTDGLRVVGLGRPRTSRELKDRLERLESAGRGRRQVGLLSIAEHVARSPETLAALTASSSQFAYLACGGRRGPATVTDGVRDPGPLTRLDLDTVDDPIYLTVTVRASRVRLATAAAGDRPLVVARLDATSERKIGGLRKQLRDRLSAKGVPQRPLLRLDLVTNDGIEPTTVNGEELKAQADELIAPTQSELRATTQDDVLRASGREPIERGVLSELTSEREPAFAALAASVFERLARHDDDEADRIADEILRYVDRTADDAGGGRDAPR